MYTTVTDVQAYLGIATGTDDALITQLIVHAQAAIDTRTRRTFEGSAEDRTFDATADVEGAVLWVYSAGDLASIVTVANGNGDSVASTAYVTEPRNAVAKGKPIIGLRLKTNSAVYWRTTNGGVPEDAITVNGIWAYSATAPSDIELATKAMAAAYYQVRTSASSGQEIKRISMDDVTVEYGGTSSASSSGKNYFTVTDLIEPYIKEFY
jgi:hypothetical protein